MNYDAIANNLKRLRARAGFSQQALAEKAGLSRSGYRKIEAGRNLQPRPESLRALASALGVGLKELLVPVRPLQRVRFRSLKRLKGRDQILADVAGWLADFSDLESLLGVSGSHSFDELEKCRDNSGQWDVPAVAACARQVFGLNEQEPVHDICGLLEAHGIKIRSVEFASDSFMGLSVGPEEQGGPAIVVNTWHRLPVETWIFSAAHELGHLLMHLKAYDVSELEEDDAQEKEANEFASHFLMPETAFRAEWDEAAGLSLVDRVFKVKRVFRVSWRTVLYRVALDVPLDRRSEVWQRFNIEYRRLTNKSLFKHNEPGGIEAEVYHSAVGERPIGKEPSSLDSYDFQADRLALLVRQALERGVITMARAAEILHLRKDKMRDLTASWVA